MNKRSLFFMALILFAGMASRANGQSPQYQHRHHHTRSEMLGRRLSLQNRRITNGAHSGKLNDRETRRLRKQEARNNRLKNKYLHSGNGISKREGRRVNRRLNRRGRSINKKKNN